MNTPKIAAGLGGDLHLAWWTEDGTVFGRSRVDGLWEDSWTLSPKGLRSKYPDISLGSRYVYAAWMEGRSGGYRAVYAWRTTARGASWSPPSPLPSTGREEQHPIIVADADDIPHVVWSPEITDLGVRYVAYARGASGGFTSPETISDVGVLHYPSLAVRGRDLFACWQTGSYRAGSSVDINVRSGGVWRGEASVPYSRGATFSDIAASPAGDIVYVVWDAGNDIFFARSAVDGGSLPPVADFSLAPESGDYPLEVAFDAAASYDPDGRIVGYDWAFGDGATDKGKSARHTYTREGSFTARLTVRDDGGKAGTAERTVEVGKPNAPPTARFSFTPKTGDAPLRIVFDASASSDADGRVASYAWSFGDGQAGEGTIVRHTFANDGTFKVELTVVDDRGGRGSVVRSISVLKANVPPAAAFSFSPAAGLCPLEVAFDASTSSDADGWIVSYLWSFGDGASGSGRIVRHTFASKGIYKVRLTVGDDRQGSAAKEAVLTAWTLFPPLGIRWETEADRTLFHLRYITNVRWDANPQNDGLASITGYRIYRKSVRDGSSAYRMLAEVAGSVFSYRDVDVGGIGLYDYAVTSLDGRGHESPIE
jgi:PKD repeat protein